MKKGKFLFLAVYMITSSLLCSCSNKQTIEIKFIGCNHEKYINEHVFEKVTESEDDKISNGYYENYSTYRYYDYNFDFNEDYYLDAKFFLPSSCKWEVNHPKYFLYIDEDTQFTPRKLTQNYTLYYF